VTCKLDLETLVHPLERCKTLCEGEAVKADLFSIIDGIVEGGMNSLSTGEPALMVYRLRILLELEQMQKFTYFECMVSLYNPPR
jgi:hypothetical protein